MSRISGDAFPDRLEILSFECAVGCYIGISSCACLRLYAGSRREEGENVSSIKCYKSESGHWRDKEKYCKIYSPRKLVVHGERAHTQASARFAIGSEDRKNNRNIYILLFYWVFFCSRLHCDVTEGIHVRATLFAKESFLLLLCWDVGFDWGWNFRLTLNARQIIAFGKYQSRASSKINLDYSYTRRWRSRKTMKGQVWGEESSRKCKK